MNKFILSTVVLLALQDACDKPTFCDEHCMREKRQQVRQPKDGDTVMAEGAARAGKLSQPKDAPPEIIYPDGTRQDAGTIRMVVIPGGER